ncbi:hypothetical protein [Halobellus sp. EA9]|uniref:hypothetical protein n=1 Tax=Halobellus sp. EA9 TaxID=3421647 RepID=UPI003EB7864B
MLTRRQLVAGLGSAAVSGGIVSSTAAFTATSSSSEASFTIVYPDLIELRAVNDPPVHVETNDAGLVTKLTPGADTGLNERAITRFAEIVKVVNSGTVDLTGIYFDFEVESDVLSSGTMDDIEAALSITAGPETLDSTGTSGDDLLAVSDAPDVTDGVLSPGESVPFGLQVDLIPDHGDSSLSALPPDNGGVSADDYSVTLSVTVTDE